MISTDFQNSLDLRSLAEQVSELKKHSGDEVSGPCPLCGGTDRFVVAPRWFFCRQCHTKRGDAIEFARWLYGDDFKSAVARLNSGAIESVVANHIYEAAKIERTWDAEKQAAQAKRAHAHLISNSAAKPARLYLAGRGLTIGTVLAYGIGCVLDKHLPGTWDEGAKTHVQASQAAVTMPWLDAGGKCEGIRYRFLTEHSYTDANGKFRTAKGTAEYGSDFKHAFGWPNLSEGNNHLVICEGEINAMSIWQACGDTNVLSLGSESSFLNLPREVVTESRRYLTVIIWCDRQNVAERGAAQIQGAVAYSNSEGNDANDLLKDKSLGSLVSALQAKAYDGRELLPSDLWFEVIGDWNVVKQQTAKFLRYKRSSYLVGEKRWIVIGDGGLTNDVAMEMFNSGK